MDIFEVTEDVCGFVRILLLYVYIGYTNEYTDLFSCLFS